MENQEILARMAGFLNGEGCFSLNRNGNYQYARFSIAQKEDTEDLQLFVDVFGGHLNGPYSGMYIYTTRRIGVVKEIFETLRPWLSKTKKSQALRVLDGDRKAI